jgi:hypothetical protein
MVVGIFSDSRIGSPMFTVTSRATPSTTFSASVSTPRPVSTFMGLLRDKPWSHEYLATQRMPLPHISPSDPSTLNMRMRTSALSLGRIMISPSLPMPKCRSDTARATAPGSSTRSSKPLT